MSSIGTGENEETKRISKILTLKQAHSLNEAYPSSSAEVHKKKLIKSFNSTKDKKDDSVIKVPPPPTSRGAPRIVISSSTRMGDSRLPMWHYLMEETFENFLLRLDDVFLSLRRDSPKDSTSTDITAYQDIGEKLRTEILISLDRLEFLAMPKDVPVTKVAFLNKLNAIKRQLSDLRWQYHNAIKGLGSKMV